ncbi:MAG TPA: hypothetical protein VEC16_00815 [Alphaproteobacteria bacterium]|nr:hypothetical protein [Alphaproteobacteria bacterium]
MVKKSKKASSKSHKINPSARSHNAKHKESFEKGLLEVDKTQDKYDKLFEQKLSEQYKEFRNLKEHKMQTKKFYGMIFAIIVIVLAALLLISYG